MKFKKKKSADLWSGRPAAAAQQHLQVQFLVSVEGGSTHSSPDTSHAITSTVSATTGSWMPNKVAGDRYWQAGLVKYTAVLRQIHPHKNYSFLPFHTYCTRAHRIMHFSQQDTLKHACVWHRVTYLSKVAENSTVKYVIHTAAYVLCSWRCYGNCKVWSPQ